MGDGPKSSLAVPLAIVIAGIAISLALYFTSGQPSSIERTNGGESSPAPKETLVILENDHVLGDPDAPVRIIEYSDFECTYCKRFHDALTAVRDAYGKTGEVVYIFRHFPLDTIHTRARAFAMLTECAAEFGGEGAFWKAHDLIMEETGLLELPDAVASLGTLLDIDGSLLTECVESGRYNARIDRDFALGVESGIGGTPVSFIVHNDGRSEKLNGVYSFDEMKTLIDDLLRAKPGNTN